MAAVGDVDGWAHHAEPASEPAQESLLESFKAKCEALT